MKTVALIEKGKDGSYGVYTPNLESTIIGDGATVAEAIADFQNSMKEVQTAFEEAGEPLPEELQDIEFEYRFDIASVFNYYDFINVSKLEISSSVSPGNPTSNVVLSTALGALSLILVNKSFNKALSPLLFILFKIWSSLC